MVDIHRYTYYTIVTIAQRCSKCKCNCRMCAKLFCINLLTSPCTGRFCQPAPIYTVRLWLTRRKSRAHRLEHASWAFVARKLGRGMCKQHVSWREINAQVKRIIGTSLKHVGDVLKDWQVNNLSDQWFPLVPLVSPLKLCQLCQCRGKMVCSKTGALMGVGVHGVAIIRALCGDEPMVVSATVAWHEMQT